MSPGSTETRNAQTRLLDPSVLASMSNLELVAKAVVEGFVNGLHRSPKFGFSQEFVEYREYSDGDDPRYITGMFFHALIVPISNASWAKPTAT